MICLNSIIEATGRISTMLRRLRASTPSDSFCEVVRMVGIDFSLSWNVRRCSSPIAPSLAVTRTQYSGSGVCGRVGGPGALNRLTRSRTASACSWVAQKTMVFSRQLRPGGDGFQDTRDGDVLAVAARPGAALVLERDGREAVAPGGGGRSRLASTSAMVIAHSGSGLG